MSPYKIKECLTIENHEGPRIHDVSARVHELEDAGYHVTTSNNGKEITVTSNMESDPVAFITQLRHDFPALVSAGLLAEVKSSFREFLRPQA